MNDTRQLAIYRSGSTAVTQDFPVIIDDDEAWVTLETAMRWELAHHRLVDTLSASTRLSRRSRRFFASAGSTRSISAVAMPQTVQTTASTAWARDMLTF